MTPDDYNQEHNKLSLRNHWVRVGIITLVSLLLFTFIITTIFDQNRLLYLVSIIGSDILPILIAICGFALIVLLFMGAFFSKNRIVKMIFTLLCAVWAFTVICSMGIGISYASGDMDVIWLPILYIAILTGFCLILFKLVPLIWSIILRKKY